LEDAKPGPENRGKETDAAMGAMIKKRSKRFIMPP